MSFFTNWYQQAGNAIGFRRLFWRIFVAFWLGDLAIMLATGYTLIHNFESNQLSTRYNAELRDQARGIILRHELGQSVKPSKSLERFLTNGNFSSDDPDSSRGISRIREMIILDGSKKQVFNYRLSLEDLPNLYQIEVSGGSGNPYQVFAKAPVAPKFFIQALNRFQTYQFVIILISAAVVSALLSWTIVRPLKSLGNYSRSFASDQGVEAMPEKLLSRGDELGDLASDIEFMVHQTDKTMSAQQQLLHDVSHELRAPLARLQASAALMEKKFSDSSYTDRIHSECNRIDQLIQQILNFSKLDKQNEEKEVLDLKELSHVLVEDVRFEYPNTPIQIHTDDKPIYINGYPDALAQALENIIRNACKYSPDDSGVELSISQRGNRVYIEVRDHGEGVPEAEIAKLLQPFYRAGNKMHTQGFGLGLSIAQRAVHKHNGQLDIHNHADGGLVVSIQLPV